MQTTIYVVAVHEANDQIIQLEDVDGVLYDGERFLYEKNINAATFATLPDETQTSMAIEFIPSTQGLSEDGYFRTKESETTGKTLESLRRF